MRTQRRAAPQTRSAAQVHAGAPGTRPYLPLRVLPGLTGSPTWLTSDPLRQGAHGRYRSPCPERAFEIAPSRSPAGGTGRYRGPHCLSAVVVAPALGAHHKRTDVSVGQRLRARRRAQGARETDQDPWEACKDCSGRSDRSNGVQDTGRCSAAGCSEVLPEGLLSHPLAPRRYARGVLWRGWGKPEFGRVLA